LKKTPKKAKKTGISAPEVTLWRRGEPECRKSLGACYGAPGA